MPERIARFNGVNRIKPFYESGLYNRAMDLWILAWDLERCGVHDPELDEVKQFAKSVLNDYECDGT